MKDWRAPKNASKPQIREGVSRISLESSPRENQHDRMENHLNFNRRCIESFMVVFSIPMASKIWDIYLKHLWYRIVICPQLAGVTTSTFSSLELVGVTLFFSDEKRDLHTVTR